MFLIQKNGYIIMRYKDLPKFFTKNVMYKISCNDCDVFYILQTVTRTNDWMTA